MPVARMYSLGQLKTSTSRDQQKQRNPDFASVISG